MTDPLSSCPDCGSPLPPDSPQALCPACLMRQALASRTIAPDGGRSPQLPPPSPEEIADKFPGYEILECLGRGGMGAVYKARQKSLNRTVAIKILVPERVGEGKFAERFSIEAELLAKLSHPHIVTIHDFGETGGLFYLVMEFIDGVNLRDLLRDGKLEPAQALAIVPPICDALQYAHDKGIVHRDIKPENLLLDRDGRIKIADFGIASLVGAADETSGTPPYMAPEQAQGHVDRRADIYSLGAVLYEMLTGERLGNDIVAPSKKVSIDVRLDEVVLRALEQKPELRYQQASILKAQVETIVSTPGNSPSSRAESAQAPKRTSGASLPENGRISFEKVIWSCCRNWPLKLVLAVLAGILTACLGHVAAFALSEGVGNELLHLPRLANHFIYGAVEGFFSTLAVLGVIHALGRASPVILWVAGLLASLVFGVLMPGLAILLNTEVLLLATIIANFCLFPVMFVVRLLRSEHKVAPPDGWPVSRDGSVQINQSAIEHPASETPAHFSRTAILGAFFAALCIAAMILPIKAAGIAATACVATMLGWIAVSEIRRSAGKLHGLWLAVFDGLLFPLLALDALLIGLPFAAWRLMPIQDASIGIKLSLLLIPAGLAILAFVIASNVFIIRRVWRAVNKTSEVQTTSRQKPAGAESNRVRKVVFSCVLGVLLLGGASSLIIGLMTSRAHQKAMRARADFHCRVFEADAALVDRLIPAAQRKPGVQPGAKFIGGERNYETSTSTGTGTDKFTVTKHGQADTDSQMAEIDFDTLSDLLEGIGTKPGILANETREVTGIWWPRGLATNWIYSTQNDGLAIHGNGLVQLAYMVDGPRDQIRIEGQVQHNPDFKEDPDDLHAKLLYEGDAPLTRALAFLVPFVKKDRTPHYLVVVYEVSPRGNSVSQQASSNLPLLRVTLRVLEVPTDFDNSKLLRPGALLDDGEVKVLAAPHIRVRSEDEVGIRIPEIPLLPQGGGHILSGRTKTLYIKPTLDPGSAHVRYTLEGDVRGDGAKAGSYERLPIRSDSLQLGEWNLMESNSAGGRKQLAVISVEMEQALVQSARFIRQPGGYQLGEGSIVLTPSSDGKVTLAVTMVEGASRDTNTVPDFCKKEGWFVYIENPKRVWIFDGIRQLDLLTPGGRSAVSDHALCPKAVWDALPESVRKLYHDTQINEAKDPIFAPMSELDLKFNDGQDTANLLNLDTGLIEQRTYLWEGAEVAEKGPDATPLLHIGENDQALWFRARSIVYFKKVTNTWWTSDPLVTVKEIERLFPAKVGYSDPWINDIATDKSESPQTFLFRTPKGTFGILQVTGFINNPRGVKIRYKPVRFVSASQIGLEKPGTIRPIPTEAARLMEEIRQVHDSPEFRNLSSDMPEVVKRYNEEINRRLKTLQELLRGTRAEALLDEGLLLNERIREQTRDGHMVDPELRERADALGKQLQSMLESAAASPSPVPRDPAVKP